MIYVFYTVHILTCLFLIMVVLLQQGKGADLSVFGGGSTQAAFGARGAATLLHKLTVICFVIFIFTTLSIGILQRSGTNASVMSGVAAPAGEASGGGEAAEPAAPGAEEPPPAESAPAAGPVDADTEDAEAVPAAADEASEGVGDSGPEGAGVGGPEEQN